MADSKFKPVLQEKVVKEKEKAEKDAALRKEYGIEEGRTVGIKTYKDSTVVGVWKILREIIRFVTTVIILLLAAVGIISLLHPSARIVMQEIWVETFEQLKVFLPFLV